MNIAKRIIVAAAAVAVLLCASAPALADGFEPDVSLSSGYRYGKLDWNISETDNTPNILSELTWESLRIYQLRASAWTPVNRTFYLKGMFNFGWIFNGENRDSDFAQNDRGGEFERSENRADSGNVWDASAGVGYIVFDSTFKAATLLGYSYNMQNLVMTDGFTTVCTTIGAYSCTTSLGPIAGLDSTYDTTWFGPWVGVDMMYRTENKRFTVFGSAEYHIAHYNARANWNLRSDFQHPISFEHEGRGYGIVASAGLDYALDAQWSVNGDFGIENWVVLDGTDITYNSNGTTASTQLNKVNWFSTALMLGLKYRY